MGKPMTSVVSATAPDCAERPLRVLQVNSSFDGGGADCQTIELSAALRAQGDDVTLLVPDDARWTHRARERALPITTFERRMPGRWALVSTCARLIRTRSIDIVHAHQGCDYWPVVLASRMGGLGRRIVVTRHTLKRPRALSRALLLAQAEVIAVSRAVEGVSREHLRGQQERVHQISCGLDFSRFVSERTPAGAAHRGELGLSPDSVVFGVVGSFDPPTGKGQLLFLEAAAALHRESPRARFIIVGRGRLESTLRHRIQDLGLDSVAAVHPFCDDAATLMNALDVLVHPTTSLEAFGLVVVEALAAGRPVIASRRDGLVECFDDGVHGLFLPPGDVPALASGMTTLLRDPALRVRLGEAGARHVRTAFGADAMARRTRAVYARVLEG